MKIIPLIVFTLAFFQTNAQNQLLAVMVNDTLSPSKLVKEYFLGKGIVVSNIKFKGENDALGIFEDPSQLTGFRNGIIISNGRIELLPGKNSRPNAGANFGRQFFFDEDFITKSNMCDGAVLEFDFVPMYDSIAFRFVFGSEEYPEFVGKNFNDAFALLLKPKIANGKYKNIGTLPDGTAVMINNINHKRNKDWYVANDYFESPLYPFLEYDGLTKPITAAARVIPKQPYHLKILIADLEDCDYDSGVLLEALSFNSYATRKKEPIRKQYYFNFENDKYLLKKEEIKKVKQVTDSFIRASFDSIIIIGHTDDNGKEENNLQLSKNRAQTIATYFTVAGIKTKTINVYGFGSSQPLQNNNTESGRAANRRVEILFYPKTY